MLWRSLAADDRVVDGDIAATSRKTADRWRIDVTVADAAVALAMFEDMTTGGGRYQPLADAMSLEVGTGRGVRPGVSVETDADGRAPAGAIAAYEAVLARYPVVHAALRPERVSIVVAGGADQVRARDLARRAAPGLGAAVEVTSG